MAEQRFDFLRELVKNLPDISLADEAAANYNELDDGESTPEQDSFSDAATEHNQSIEINERPSTSMTTNGVRQNGQDDGKLRRTRSMQQFEVQQQQQQQQQLWERLQKTTAASNYGVIKHTNNNNKLLRTESAPQEEALCLAPKRSRQAASTTTTAKYKQTNASLVAPIVSVQFDYSNIDWKQKNDKNVPQSAPAQIVQPMFDFSHLADHQSPISINIDLSSININKTTTTTTTSTFQNAGAISHSAKCRTGTIPKADVKPNTTITTATTTLAKPKDTLLELDEDYDDI